MHGEKACGAGKEPCGGEALTAGKDFGIAGTGITINRYADVVVIAPASPNLLRPPVGAASPPFGMRPIVSASK